MEDGEIYTPGDRIRAKGAGVKQIIDTDKTFLKDLETLLDPKGDPMSPIRWTTLSGSFSDLTQGVRTLYAKVRTSQTPSQARILPQS